MSENNNEGQEKNFEASESKLRKSREQGDIAQSQETNTLFLYLGFVVAVFLMGGSIANGVFKELSAMLARPKDMGDALLSSGDGRMFSHLIMELAGQLAPIFIIPMGFIIASLIAQQAIVIAPERIRPKGSRLSIISNAKEKYGPKGIVEFLKKLAKLGFITIIAIAFFYRSFVNLPSLAALHAQDMMPQMRDIAISLTLFILVPTALIAAIDLPYVRFSHLKKLRMTLQEVRDEAKESEGDPHMKRERRARAEAITQANMMRDVKGANVIIVNPTHYAVALKWDREAGQVPMCVAKGVDEIAARIRRLAEKHDVPIHSDPSCARSLYATVEVGHGILPEHYAAVAAAIYFADRLKKAPW